MPADPTPEDASSGGWPLIGGWARATLSPTGLRCGRRSPTKAPASPAPGAPAGKTAASAMSWGSTCNAASRAWRPSCGIAGGRARRGVRGRLDWPLIRLEGSEHYTPISWEEVHALTAEAFRRPAPERVASYSSGRSSNEAAFLLQLLLRALGSNNLAECSDLCHAPSTVGLSRVSGSGIAGILQPSSGVIHIDGYPITAIPRTVAVASLAMVQQEIAIYGMSIRDNLCLWRDHLTDEQLLNACHDAQLMEVIEALPDGLNSRLAEGGRNLSGGQRLVLEQGQVVQRGRHEALISDPEGAYARLLAEGEN